MLGLWKKTRLDRFQIHTETHHRPQLQWQLSPDTDSQSLVEEMEVSEER